MNVILQKLDAEALEALEALEAEEAEEGEAENDKERSARPGRPWHGGEGLPPLAAAELRWPVHALANIETSMCVLLA